MIAVLAICALMLIVGLGWLGLLILAWRDVREMERPH
jgi:hypothetical protein